MCFLRFSKRKGVDDSDVFIFLKIKAQLNQLVNWKLWVALIYPEQLVEF